MSMIKMIYFSMYFQYFHLEVKRIISDKDKNIKILDILLEMLLILFILD